ACEPKQLRSERLGCRELRGKISELGRPILLQRMDEYCADLLNPVLRMLSLHQEMHVSSQFVSKPGEVRGLPVRFIKEVAALRTFGCRRKSEREKCIRPVGQLLSPIVPHCVPCAAALPPIEERDPVA